MVSRVCVCVCVIIKISTIAFFFLSNYRLSIYYVLINIYLFPFYWQDWGEVAVQRFCQWHPTKSQIKKVEENRKDKGVRKKLELSTNLEARQRKEKEEEAKEEVDREDDGGGEHGEKGAKVLYPVSFTPDTRSYLPHPSLARYSIKLLYLSISDKAVLWLLHRSPMNISWWSWFDNTTTITGRGINTLQYSSSLTSDWGDKYCCFISLFCYTGPSGRSFGSPSTYFTSWSGPPFLLLPSCLLFLLCY